MLRVWQISVHVLAGLPQPLIVYGMRIMRWLGYEDKLVRWWVQAGIRVPASYAVSVPALLAGW